MPKKKSRFKPVFSSLDSRNPTRPILDGFWFVMSPERDPVAWDAISYYASITPNTAQRNTIVAWLVEHPKPEVVSEQETSQD